MINSVQQARVDFINFWPNYFIQNNSEYKEIIFKKWFNFIPLNIKYINNPKANVIYSYIIESFSFMIDRPDLSFDYIWRAFEEMLWWKDPTEKIKLYSTRDISFINDLAIKLPLKSCEFIYKKIELSNQLNLNKKEADKLNHYIDSNYNFFTKDFLNYIKFHLWNDRKSITLKSDKTLKISNEQLNEGALFFRNLLKTKKVLIENREINLSNHSINFIFLYSYLFTLRNSRVHWLSISPFISTKVSLKTYLHYHYAFLSSYYLLIFELNRVYNFWLTMSDFSHNIDLNLNNLYNIFWKDNFD